MGDRPVEVIPGILIGSLDSISEQFLEEEKIDAIINLSCRTYKNHRAIFNIVMDDIDIPHHQMKFYVQKFAIGVAAIETAVAEGMKVLIHCAAGINRSATLIGLYLIELGMSYDDAIGALKNANAKRGVDLLTNKSFALLMNTHYELKRGFTNRSAELKRLTKK